MLHFIERARAKRQYVRETLDAAHRTELNAELAAQNAANARRQAEALQAEAQAIDDNIKAVAEKEEKGYWLCEDGHEEPLDSVFADKELELERTCTMCRKPMKHIRRDLMSGQERYESDKERNEAEKIAASKREAAEERIKFAEGAENASKSFHDQARSGFDLARKIKNL